MRTEYSPFVDTLGARFTHTPLVIGGAIDLAIASTGSLDLEVLYGGTGNPFFTTYAFNPNDRPRIVEVALFANFADGLLISSPIECALRLFNTAWGAGDDQSAVILPALNTWFDAEQFLIPADPLAGNQTLKAVSIIGTLRTDIIDAAFAGADVSFDLLVKVAHSYSLEV